MNYGKVEERSSSRSRSPNTARRAATSAILTDILSRSDRAPTSRTADARLKPMVLKVYCQEFRSLVSVQAREHVPLPQLPAIVLPEVARVDHDRSHWLV